MLVDSYLESHPAAPLLSGFIEHCVPVPERERERERAREREREREKEAEREGGNEYGPFVSRICMQTSRLCTHCSYILCGAVRVGRQPWMVRLDT